MAEINSLRTEPPDRSECVLPMGRIEGQELCPEYERFQIKCWCRIRPHLSLTLRHQKSL